MGQAYLMRRGSAKGLKVLSCASTDEFPEIVLKNTMAVISDVPSVHIYIQAERPENGASGDVWAKTKDGDDISLYTSASSLETGLMYVEQYDGDKWKRVEAHVYDGDKWRKVSSATLFLYDRGKDFDDLTGGWDKDENTGMSITFGTDGITLKITKDADRYATAYTKKKINVKAYNSLCMLVSNANGSGTSGSLYIGLTEKVYTGGAGSELLASFKAGASRSVSPDKGESITDETEIAADISALDGEYIVQFGASIANATVHEIYLK